MLVLPCASNQLYFNPRTREECDIKVPLRWYAYIKFQSTHSRGVRPLLSCLNINLYCISIHALARSATSRCETVELFPYISIHALARSATKFNPSRCPPDSISIHALARSATYGNTLCWNLYALFQSTHSRGVRHVSKEILSKLLNISIHALARSATRLGHRYLAQTQ